MKPYLKPPKAMCELCGVDLVQRGRYRVRLYRKVRIGKVTLHLEVRNSVVCEDCFRALLNGLNRKEWVLRWRRMRTLKVGELW